MLCFDCESQICVDDVFVVGVVDVCCHSINLMKEKNEINFD